MVSAKKDIMEQLKKEILVLQGFKSVTGESAMDLGLGPIAKAFPNEIFPTAAVHELISTAPEDAAATSGFVTGLLSGLMKAGRACIWISMHRTVFPPALKAFGVDPDKIIFIDLQCEKDVCWAMEEALKCEGLAAVVGEIRELSFTASRRLQLAVEKSRVTGFILRHQPRNLNTIAAVSRWRIVPLPSETTEGMPGVGLPRWNVELLKIRNGKPGAWQLEWAGDHFQPVYPLVYALQKEQIKKTG